MEGKGGGRGGDLTELFTDDAKPVDQPGDHPNPLTSSTTFLRWAISLPRLILRSRTAFSWCLRTSFTAKWQRRSLPTTCLPLPVPHPGCFSSGGSKLSQKRLRKVAHQRLLHVCVLVINYMYLGRFPTLAELGRSPNPWQLRCFQRLRALLHVCGSVPGDIPLVPGRSGFELGATLFQLEQFLAKTPELQNLYASPSPVRMKVDRNLNTVKEFPQLEPYKSLDAGRLKLVGRGNWPMEKFLQGVLWLPFQEPGFLLHGADTTGALLPNFNYEDPVETLKLAKIWDSRGLLHLSERPMQPGHFSRVFNAFKSKEQDRQIGDRRIPNSREYRIDGPSKHLPPGHLLCGLTVPRYSHQLLGSITDRRDYYHQAEVTTSRALSNMLPFSYDVLDFDGCGALDEIQRRPQGGRKRNDRLEQGDGFEAADGLRTLPRSGGKSGQLYPCFKSLFQGDHLGVEFALRSHEVLLRQAGLLRPDYRLQGHHLVPHGPRWEALIIDDYFCISAEPLKSDPLNSFSAGALAAARAAYCHHGLEGSPEKDVEAEATFKAAGAEVISSPEAVRNGVSSVGAPVAKRLALASLTLRVASMSMISPRLAARLAGNWVSVLLYRRCFSSLVDDFFALGAGCEEGPQDLLIPLNRKTAQELAMLSAIAPLICTNVALPTSSCLYATDASLGKGAVCETEVAADLSHELWLGGDRKGGYAKLDHGFAAALHAIGEEAHDDAADQEFFLKEGPYRSPLLYFDFVEFYGGSGTISACMSSLGFVTAPPLDLSASPHYDMGDLRLLEWCFYMLEEGRFKSFVTEPPCTTFSAAAHPAVRSYDQPLGYDRKDKKTWFGNLHAFRSFILLRVGARHRRPCAAEQPFLSKMAWLKSWRLLLLQGFHEVYLASCQFGSPHKKQFRFLTYGLDHPTMSVRCPGGHTHIPIQGAYTKPSAVYVKGLAMHVAKFFQKALELQERAKADDPSFVGLESVIANDVLLSSSWKTTRVWNWKAKDRRHINVLEADAAVQMLEVAARSWEDHRINSLIDSRVAKCALAKGRTSSRVLQPVCRRAASLQISGGIYPSWNFAPTRLNVADCPTRDKPFPDLCKSISYGLPLDLVRTFQIPQLSRPGANWIRLCILITLSAAVEAADLSPQGSLVELSLWTEDLLPFFTWKTSSLLSLCAQSLLGLILAFLFIRQPSPVLTQRVCFPGKLGPRWFVLISLVVVSSHGMPLGPETAAERGRADTRSTANLQATRVVRKQTLDSREKLLHEFGRWLWDEKGVRLSTLFAKKPPDPEEICAFLVSYGQEMFLAGRSYGRYAETINSIAAARPLIKKQLTAAWDLAFCWLSDEPHQHHPAMPRSVLLASTTLALMWGWPYVASVLCIGWAGIMRIGEVMMARRSDLVLPSDAAPGLHCILVKIRSPKTRGRSAKHQSARIDPIDIVKMVTAVYQNFDGEQPLWPFSPATLRKRFAALMHVLELDVRRGADQAPFDLGSLRPGGATDLLFETEDSELVRRRGRWLSARVMEIYLQEVLFSTYVGRLPLNVQERIEKLALLFPEVLEQALGFLRTGIPPSVWYQLFQAQST